MSDHKDGDWTALMMAAKFGQLELVWLLCHAGADLSGRKNDSWTALVVRLLCHAGADLFDSSDAGNMALIFTVRERHLEAVQLLYDEGANFSARDDWSYIRPRRG